MKFKYLTKDDNEQLKKVKIGYIYDILMEGAKSSTQVLGLISDEIALLIEEDDEGDTFIQAISDVEEIIIEQKDDNLYFIIDGTKFKSVQLSKSRLSRFGYDDLSKDVNYYGEEVAQSVLKNSPKTFKIDLDDALTVDEDDIIEEDKGE